MRNSTASRDTPCWRRRRPSEAQRLPQPLKGSSLRGQGTCKCQGMKCGRQRSISFHFHVSKYCTCILTFVVIEFGTLSIPFTTVSPSLILIHIGVYRIAGSEEDLFACEILDCKYCSMPSRALRTWATTWVIAALPVVTPMSLYMSRFSRTLSEST